MEWLSQINPHFGKEVETMWFLQIYLTSAFTFLVCFYMGHFVFRDVIQLDYYKKMNWHDQADFLSRVTAQLHAAFSACGAYWLIFKSCDSADQNIFTDSKCFNQFHPFAYELLAFSVGYITFDLIIILKEIQDFSALGMQNIMHHFIALTATVSGLLAGTFNPLVAAATTFTEVSTILLHVRYYMIKMKCADGKPFLAVMIGFISSFAYSRMYI